MNFKILTKILANRLMSVLGHLISPDQTWFMPGKAADNNLRWVYTHLQLGPEISMGRILVFLDLEKVFDLVDWQKMQGVLPGFGFGPIFHKWISLIYIVSQWLKSKSVG